MWRPSLRYCAQTEVHVFALSVAASVLLSVFPFLIVMMSLCKYGLRWPAGVAALDVAVSDFFPGDMGQFIHRNLLAVVQGRGPFQIISLFLLMFTANGVFEPLEVALNRAWGVPENRSYMQNQLVSLGLIFLCGGLALVSFVLTAVNRQIVSGWIPIPAFWVYCCSNWQPCRFRSSRSRSCTGCCQTGRSGPRELSRYRFWSG